MSASEESARARNTAKNDFQKALLRAEKITEGWYRCQALAAVARFAPEGDVVRVANKALKPAETAGDAYKRVAVAAWPVRALIERGKVRQAQEALRSLQDEISRIEPPVSKINALFLLWQAVWPLPWAIKQPVLDSLVAACQVTESWQAGCILRDVALMVAAEDREQANRIVQTMRDGPFRRQAERRLEAGQWETVRAFFD